MRFAGKIALVTGSSRGIGRSTATRLAREGAAVVVHYRREEDLAREVVAEIEGLGGRAVAERADLEDEEAIARLFAAVRERFGALDVLVANAAATSFRPLLEAETRHVRRTYAITVDAFLRAVREAVPLMEGRGGAILAVSGFDSFRVVEGHGVLGSAKAAMETLVRYLAVELAPRGIRVNGVNPGYIETDSARTYAERTFGADEVARRRAEWVATTPAGRIADPAEIASVIAFLASAEASFVYGQTLVADGGLTLR
jgi:enoyl-[acyl-carrier protein] reductase III